MISGGFCVLRFSLPIFVVFFLAGCASTDLKSTWRSPDDQGSAVKNVAVFMLSDDDNLRRFAEDQMVRALPRGTTATAGYRLFAKPEANFDAIRASLREKGYDAILMARTISVDKTQHRVPSSTQIVPLPPPMIGLTDPKAVDAYYRNAWGYTYQRTPGYTANVTTIVIETVLYRLPSGEAVWSGVTETHNPASQAEMVMELARLVEKQLVKENLVGLPVASGR